MRFLTVSLLWYVRYEIPATPDYPVSVRLRLYNERDVLLSQIKAWEIAMQVKSEDESGPQGQ
jgi:PIN domain nuclease of toxin-antitoxin system